MCYSPITIKTPQGYKTVPCGKCLECLRKYQSDWSNRMFEELKANDGKAVFFTLTYDEQNVPKNYLYYVSATDYVIFRSPSDYGYDNTYIDDNGKEKVLPSRKGERKHKKVDPAIEVTESGIESSIIDFNIQRKDQLKFREQIQKLYGDYIRLFNSNNTDIDSVSDFCSDYNFDCYDFDTFNGDDFGMCETDVKDQEMMLDLFEQVLEDEIPEKEDEEKVPIFDAINALELRQRPVMMFNSVRKKDVQDWIKRARQRRKRIAKKTGEPEQKFTFFITSEYGPRTLRPHYHGVLFGVTAEDTVDMRSDWQRHHGRKISWDNVDLSKGDMSYCAKYCSKGFYEHPLCSKDFFYKKPLVAGDKRLKPFTEYHSKHYERCIEIFNIDAPIVDPTFHLVSKGLGVSWVEANRYLVEDFNDIDFKDNEVKPTIKVAYTPKIKENEEKEIVQDESSCFAASSILYDLSLTTGLIKEDEHIITLKSKEIKSKDYAECIDRFFQKFHYYRTFKGETIAYGVPKYYRSKILSDGLRCAFANYIQQVNVELYQEKFESLRAENPDREDSEIVSMLEEQEVEEKYRRMSDCRKRLDKIYNKSKI